MCIRDRFLYHLVGFLLANEQEILEAYGTRYFVPLVWAQNVINVAKREGRMKEDIGAQKLFVVRLLKLLLSAYSIMLCHF